MRSRKAERIHMNGMDGLMMAFDYQMKKSGFAGNLAQMVMGLPRQVPEAAFRKRIEDLYHRFPIIGAASGRNFFSRRPCWRIPADGSSGFPCITVYRTASRREDNPDFSGLRKKLFNRPLQPKKGEQIRFDLVYFDDGGMEIYMTWVHALMDAHGGEYFFSMIGNPGLAEAAQQFATERESRYTKSKAEPAGAASGDRWRKMQQSFDHIDQIALKPPVSILTRFSGQAAPIQEYRIMSFSREETVTVLEYAKKRCGLFNESSCFAAAVMCSLKSLYRKKQMLSDNYVLSLPVNLRKKGTYLPVFSNQSTSLLYAFDAGNLEDFQAAAAQFKEQTQTAIKTGLLDANVAMMEVSKFLPTWFYIKKVRQAMKGEIASMVFANPGPVHSSLSEFMGIPVDYVRHMPAIIAPPGIGGAGLSVFPEAESYLCLHGGASE